MNMALIVLLAAIVLVALVCCIAAVRRRRLVTAVVVAVLALVVVAITVLETVRPGNGPAIKGGYFLKAAPGIRLYVGERVVGTGKVFLRWKDLLVSEGNQPLAIKLNPEGPFNDLKLEPHGAITAETFGGGGAVCILRSNQSSITLGPDLQVMSEQILLRRADGMLDSVLALNVDCRAFDGQRLRFLVPIRGRQNLGYVVSKSEGTSEPGDRREYGPFANVPTQLAWSFLTGAPPKELTEEITEKGLWEPAAR